MMRPASSTAPAWGLGRRHVTWSRLAGVLTHERLRATGHGLVLVGLGFGAYVFLYLTPIARTFGIDAFAYWRVDTAALYELPHGHIGSFPYAPPAAMVADLFSAAPFWIFLWFWTMLLVGSVMWLGGSLGWIIAAFAVPFVSVELYHGNIHILIAVAVVLGFRHPWTWAFVLLTKTSCGVGLLWFAVRREWRSLAVALGTTALIAGVSFVLAPGLWWEWVGYLRETPETWTSPNAIAIPLPIRLALAAALVVWGARTDRRWTVIVAVTLALPVMWIHGLAVLVGLFGEMEHRRPALGPRTGSMSRWTTRLPWPSR